MQHWKRLFVKELVTRILEVVLLQDLEVLRSRSGTRSGAMSASRMDRIRRMQQGNREKQIMMILNVESSGSIESNPGNVDAGGSFESSPSKRPHRNRGWCSAARSRPKNAWTGRYHRALSFLRVRGAFVMLLVLRTFWNNRKIKLHVEFGEWEDV